MRLSKKYKPKKISNSIRPTKDVLTNILIRNQIRQSPSRLRLRPTTPSTTNRHRLQQPVHHHTTTSTNNRRPTTLTRRHNIRQQRRNPNLKP
ncbi:hypothetical protein HanPSC8_Chr02g0055801 [Helianthus annuus]|nr:hypothetical protein HanPSC8_Chr02g0055801 [Helianthus annuus]